MAGLRYVDPHRPRGRCYLAWARLTGTRLVGRLSTWTAWRLDPHLMRLTRGRLGFGLLLPTALLETTGARSGAPRSNGVIYFHDGDRAVIVASKMGLPDNPAWLHNLRAHPEVRLGGEPFRAAEVEDEAERERLWSLADRVFPPFATYRRRAAAAGRTISIVALEPR